MSNLASQFKLEYPNAIRRGVVEKWLDGIHESEPEFVDYFIEYSKRDDACKATMFQFARKNGFEGGETSMKKYMQNIKAGLVTYTPLTSAQ